MTRTPCSPSDHIAGEAERSRIPTGSIVLLLAAICAAEGPAASQTLRLAMAQEAGSGRRAELPYGRQAPEAPPETEQYAFLIGTFDCTLDYKEFRDGEWVSRKRGRATWRASWVLGGFAILDEFTDEWGSRALNVRIFDTEAGVWRIHWAGLEVPAGDIFDARRVDGRMVMDAERTTDGGFEYVQRFAFEPVSQDRYRWTNEIVNPDGPSVTIDEIECVRGN